MTATVVGLVGYNLGGTNNTDPKTTTLPADLADGDVLDLQVVLGSGTADRLNSVLTIDGVAVEVARRSSAQYSGYTSLHYSVPLTVAMSGKTLAFTTGGTATRPPTMSGVVLRGITGMPVVPPAHVPMTPVSTTTITTPRQNAGQTSVVEVSHVQDVESSALPATALWTPPEGVTLVRASYSQSPTIPVMSSAVGVDLTPKAQGAALGGRAWTKDNGAYGGGWTVQYGVTGTAPIVSPPASGTSYASNDAAARITHTAPVPTSATADRRVLASFTIASGSRLLTATLQHADGTTRTLTELAPKAALTNGGHAHHVLVFACDEKTAGATLRLYQQFADGTTPDTQIKASILLTVLQGVGEPVGVTAPANSSTATKTSPTLIPPGPDYVEITLVSDSASGVAPVISTTEWKPPDGFELLVADYQAGATTNPVSTSAIAARLGTRLPKDTPAGGRVWSSDQPARGAAWTVLFPVLSAAGRNGGGIFAITADGYIPLTVRLA